MGPRALEVREDAPVLVRLEREVPAEPDDVWELWTDVQRWPLWHPGVDFAVLGGDPRPGTRLQWRADGMRISSILHQVERPTLLSWTVRTLGARGYHRWTFESGGEGTRIRTEESWWGVVPFVLRRTLRRTLRASRTAWLEGVEKGLQGRRP